MTDNLGYHVLPGALQRQPGGLVLYSGQQKVKLI